MTYGEKMMIAGWTAGAVASVVPAVYGYVKSRQRGPIRKEDMLHAEGEFFKSECGELVLLKGVNLNDENFCADENGIAVPYNELFSSLETRFGYYGARKAIMTHNENFVSVSDLKTVAKLGANCVRIPIRPKTVCRKDGCKGEYDFTRLDKMVEKCAKLGIFVIFDMHSAPGCQNNDPSCGSDMSCKLFDRSKEGFENRNAAIRFWSILAAHYKDEPAVAAYDLLNRPLSRVSDRDDKLEILHKFYNRAYKAIRGVDENHVIIMQAAESVETLPDPEAYGWENVAMGIYSHMHTSFEIKALSNSIAKFGGKYPFVACKVRTAENSRDVVLSALSQINISWLAGDYKGPKQGGCCLFKGDMPRADLENEDFAEIIEKWSQSLAKVEYEKDEEYAAALKRYFAETDSVIPEFEKQKKYNPELHIKLGFNVIKGV